MSKESWEKQHIVSRPWSIKARRGCDEAEKLDHIALTDSRSWTGNASRDYRVNICFISTGIKARRAAVD